MYRNCINLINFFLGFLCVLECFKNEIKNYYCWGSGFNKC